jgi:hypothetical protein
MHGNKTTQPAIGCVVSVNEFLSHCAGDGIPPGVVHFGELGGEFAAGGFHHELAMYDNFHALRHKVLPTFCRQFFFLPLPTASRQHNACAKIFFVYL